MQSVQKDIRLGELAKQVEDLQLNFDVQTERLQSEQEENQARAFRAEQRAAELEKTVQALPTIEEYNKLKSRLQILRVLDIDVDDPSSGDVDLTAESVLRDRARKLESENVKLRTNVVDLEDRVNRLSSDLSAAQAQDKTKDGTIHRLEEELSRQVEAVQAAVAASAAALLAHPAVGSSASSSSSTDAPVEAVSPGEPPSDLLTIVTGQRDRFRAKVTALEDETRTLADQLKASKVELRAVSDDNVKLYQRIKYLQSYGELSKGRVDLETGALSTERDVEDKYKQIYETSVDPFAVFNRNERSKRKEGLNPAERLVLDTSSFFLANRTTRMILFGYMLVLHLLVFLSTWRLAHTSADCPRQTIDLVDGEQR